VKNQEEKTLQQNHQPEAEEVETFLEEKQEVKKHQLKSQELMNLEEKQKKKHQKHFNERSKQNSYRMGLSL
jgi:hypothetical protein